MILCKVLYFTELHKCLKSFYVGERVAVKELLDGSYADSGGESWSAFVAKRSKAGMLGIYNAEGYVYIWSAPDKRDLESLVFLMAHELWHVRAIEEPKPATLCEEDMANSVAAVATQALKLAKQIKENL